MAKNAEELHSLLRQLADEKAHLERDRQNALTLEHNLKNGLVAPENEKQECNRLLRAYRAMLERSAVEADLVAATKLALGTMIANRTAGGSGTQSSIINNLETFLPVWPKGAPPLALCGCVPPPEDWAITPGHHVAAMVSKKPDTWYLCTVVKPLDKDRYLVEDIMDETGEPPSGKSSGKKRYTLARSKVLALPRWACQDVTATDACYPIGTKVLALYPQTTCFYPAEVARPPTADDPNTYTMHFDDDDHEDGRTRYQDVALHYVVKTRP
eukprot:m.151023 g.151023  ORF g.151023 m.151023 type:complete len:270 (+) comp17844_c0_seq2:159-968(+)